VTLTLSSTAFSQHGPIPAQFTCDGANTAPPLQWSQVPSGAKSLALLVDDPDAPDPLAPKQTFVHWVVYDIAPSSAGLPEGGGLPPGARHGTSDAKKTGYMGPCPPIGRHRYCFKLYALDVVLGDLHAPTKRELEAAMRGHGLEQAELVGLYERAAGVPRR
jgi:Raf kinase inhibitor-like YbhB/YbcL family protein